MPGASIKAVTYGHLRVAVFLLRQQGGIHLDMEILYELWQGEG